MLPEPMSPIFIGVKPTGDAARQRAQRHQQHGYD
jgi:hypothetical protein